VNYSSATVLTIAVFQFAAKLQQVKARRMAENTKRDFKMEL
jgi:hypothetical protein